MMSEKDFEILAILIAFVFSAMFYALREFKKERDKERRPLRFLTAKPKSSKKPWKVKKG